MTETPEQTPSEENSTQDPTEQSDKEGPTVDEEESDKEGPTVDEFVIEYDDEFAFLVSEGKRQPGMRPKGFRESNKEESES